MAKKTKEIQITMGDNELEMFKKAAKDIGGDVLDELDNCPGFIDTGILAVNYIISGKFVGGGFAIGHMAEVAGENAAGKTLLGTNFLRGCQTYGGIPVFHDAENAISKDFAIKASHIDPKRLLVTKSDTLEGSFNQINRTIRNLRGEKFNVPLEKPLSIVYDSIAISPSNREFAQTTIDVEEATQSQIKEAGAGVERPGERAKICSAELRKLNSVCFKNNVAMLFVNQLRKKIGVMYGDDWTEAGGGEALKFVCSIRIRMHSYKQLKDAKGQTIGMNVTFKCKKTRFTGAHKEAKNVHLFYEKGIDPFGGLLELLINDGRVIQGGGGNYTVAEKYSGGRVVKFKSSKEENTVPVETLLDCPALVDATSPDQIQYYVDMFGDAAAAVSTDIAAEVDFLGDE